MLINYSCGLKPDEKILIEVHGREVPLARALIEEAYKAKGKPFLHLYDYKLERALLKGMTAEHEKEIGEYDLNVMKDMDAYIDIRATENLTEGNNIPEEKQGYFRKYYTKPVHLKERCTNTKWAVLRYPNDAMAQLAGMSTEDYEDFYFNACLADYSKMGKAMQSLGKLMDRTDKVRIKAPGTELTFSIKGIPSVPLDGHRNIPDGEIYTSPVRDSVNGIISFNVPSPQDDCVFKDIVLKFKDGKIIDAKSSDTEKLNKILDVDDGARYIGEFAFGVNPMIDHPITDILFDEKIYGSFHLTPGKCYANASNGNMSSLHWDMIQIQRPEYGGGEIYFDDILIRKDGVFVLDELKCLNPENLK